MNDALGQSQAYRPHTESKLKATGAALKSSHASGLVHMLA